MAFSTSDVLEMIDDWRSDNEDICEDPEFQLPREDEDESEEELTDEGITNNDTE